MKTTVLITAIGTINATAVALALKKEEKFHIIGADMKYRYEVAGALLCDEYYSFPSCENEGYVDFALNFCKEHKVDYYYIVIDKEVVKVSKLADEFEKLGVKLCTVDYKFAMQCHYKDKFAAWIKDYVPEVYTKTYKTIDDIDSTSFPIFIKPVEGVASTGCKRINTYEELRAEVFNKEFNEQIVIQEFVEGRNITVDLVRNRKTKQKAQLQRVELVRNAHGCGIAVEIINNDILANICDQLMEKLDLNGVCNAEFFDCGNDTFKIIEVNPRFSAGTTYSCLAGLNTVKNAMLIADGNECEFGEIAYGKHFAERYEAYKMD